MNKNLISILSYFSLFLSLQGAHAEKRLSQCPDVKEVMKNIAYIKVEAREFESIQANHLQGKLKEAFIRVLNKNEAILYCYYQIKNGNDYIPGDIITYKSKFRCAGDDAISFREGRQVSDCEKAGTLEKSCPVWCAIND